MRKITFLFTFLLSTFAFSQVGVSENFDSGTPTGWTDSYGNTSTQACEGNSERDNLYSGSATGNITTPNYVGGSNGTDLTITFDYKIVDWSAATSATAAGWGTAELQYSTDDGANWITALTINDSNHVVANTCANMMAVIPAASLPNGSDVKLQIATTWANGDYYFYVDNFNATQVAVNPPNCTTLSAPVDGATDVSEDSDLEWNTATGVATGYKLTVGTTSGGTDVVDNLDVGLVTSYSLTLAYGTTYYVTIVPYNANGDAVGCTEESFTIRAAPPAGEVCGNPIVVNTLPYTTTDNTATYGDDYSGSPGASCGSTSSYLNGDDVVYSYTPAADASIDIALSSLGDTYAGVFVYTDCADIGTTCQTGAVNGSSSADFGIDDYVVTAGTTYYIVISTWASPQSTTYTLDITENTCTNPVATYTPVADCGNSQFTIDVDITSMGTATSLTISDDQMSATQQVTMLGVASFGPYPSGTAVNLTVTNDQDGTCFIMESTQYICPPANNDCSGAIALTNGGVFATNPVVGTNEGATDSGELPAPGCASFSGGDVWYSAVVPADGMLTLEVNTETGGITDTGGAVYSGTCGSLALVACNDDGSANGAHPIININDVALANQTVYFRVWEYGNNATGEFQVSAFAASLSVEPAEVRGFTHYVNTINNSFVVNAQSNINSIEVYNLVGQIITTAKPNAASGEANLGSVKNGVYFARVTLENGRISVVKFVK